ncbi:MULTISPECIES: hypothetical protein [Streptomyces]|uniref:Holin n=1 Tax=Streptomyces cyaneofuscatus TaxID=66883 RepID=A0ABZ1EZX5_9ACTN|nr:hypothetical protein [Streptomyces cyaneofuscatus]WSB09701.1 hypothetical protein OG849_21945 [Streptomyces cyaneofuscatus]WSD46765.1 hypothetical protein OG857_13460 [Streptomyces cyaneofuscatus]WTA90139.1 hypothetical protein OG323_14475 [Streptomyces cyaneofuscatus]
MSEATRRSLRTLVQTAVALAIALPALVDASDVTESLPWAAGAVTAAAVLSRIMALDSVQRLLPRPLRTGLDDGRALAALLRAERRRG